MSDVAATMSENQKNKTLRVLKKNNKKASSFRNVLSNPYEEYWPKLNERDQLNLSELLKRKLTPCRRPVPDISWSVQKSASRSERQAMKDKNLEKNGKKQIQLKSRELMSNLVIGANAVSRAIEGNKLCCGLIADYVDPDIITKFIALEFGIRHIPMVVLSSLKPTMKAAVGFSSIALGLKNVVSESTSNHFYRLYEEISCLANKFPYPDQIRIADTGDNISIEDDSSMDEGNEIKKSVKPVYLKRSSIKERVFIPQEHENSSQNDFLAFDIKSKIAKNQQDLKHENQKTTKVRPSKIDEGNKSKSPVIMKKQKMLTINTLNKSNFKLLNVKKIVSNCNKKRKTKKKDN